MLMAPNSLHITDGILAVSAGGTTTAATAAAAAATAGDAATERSIASGRQNAQQPLRCPRCDSANTKFCYYNNYSLSQPRHFCKACKRYWTSGPTLRNVPVGGGCRKNKRPRKSRTSSAAAAAPSTGNAATTSADLSPVPRLSPNPEPSPIATTASSSGLGQSFYGDSSDVIQWPFLNPCISYDLQSQFSTLGLFPSNADEDYLQGLKTDLADHRNLPQTAPAAAATPSLNSLLHDYSLLGFNPLASLHDSSLKQQHDMRIARNTNLSLYAALLADAAGGSSPLFNGVKVEGISEGMAGGGSDNRFDWQIPSCENAMEPVAGESPVNWNAATAPSFGGGALL